MQKLAKATARILQKAGVDFGIAGDAETCCGGRAYQMGYEDGFPRAGQEEHGRDQAVRRQDSGDQLRRRATSATRSSTIGSVSRATWKCCTSARLIERLMEEGKLKPKKTDDLNVTYHDPCHLGRLGEPWIHWEGKKIPGDRFVFDPPKTLPAGHQRRLRASARGDGGLPGVTLTEMDRIKEYAWCGGSCGGVTDSNPEFAEWTASERLEEAVGHRCRGDRHRLALEREAVLTRSIKKNGGSLKVYDIVELVDQGHIGRRVVRLGSRQGYLQRVCRRGGRGEYLRRSGDDARLLPDRLRRGDPAEGHRRSAGGGQALQQVQAEVPAHLHRLDGVSSRDTSSSTCGA